MKKIVLINLCVCLLFILCSCDRQIQKDRNDTPQIADNKLKDGKSLGFSALVKDSKDENPFRCCGEDYDKKTEAVYLRARYYEIKSISSADTRIG